MDHEKGMGINLKTLLLGVLVIGSINIAKAQVDSVKTDSVEIAKPKSQLIRNMPELAKAKEYAFPYLFDPAQKIANLYGATKTPHLFLAKKSPKGLVIEYTGSIDDDPQKTNAKRIYFMEDALKALIAGKQPATKVTKAIGCTVARPKIKATK